MSEYVTALTGAGMTVLLGAVMVARALVPASPARHRAGTARPEQAPRPVDPNADTQAFGVVRTGFGWCDPCARTTSGVITRNGFRCDDYVLHQAGGAR